MVPLIIYSVNDLFRSQVLTPLHPVGLQYSTAVAGVTAEAAERLAGEYDPSLILGSDLLAGSGHVGKDSVTKNIIAAIDSIDPFMVVFGIIK